LVTAHGVSMAYVLTTFFIMGFGYYVAETALKRPLPLPGPGLGRLRARHHWFGDDDGDDPVRHGDGALHLLSAAYGEPLLLYRPRAGGRGVMDLVRADDLGDAPVQARQPRRAGAACHVMTVLRHIAGQAREPALLIGRLLLSRAQPLRRRGRPPR
jgi:hypothetical protein